MDKKRIVIFNGSPRKKGTSYSFGRTIKKLAEDSGNEVEIIHIIDYFDKVENFEDLKSIIFNSSILGLITPLYVDTLPYPVIWFLEKLESEYRDELEGKYFFAIGQCGFPDTSLCDPILGACKCFSIAAGMNWLGGLGYGCGPMINGEELEKLGGQGKKIILAFSIAVEHILKGENIPLESQRLLKPSVPKILFRPLAVFLNHRSRKLAAKEGVTDLYKKVYLK